MSIDPYLKNALVVVENQFLLLFEFPLILIIPFTISTCGLTFVPFFSTITISVPLKRRVLNLRAKSSERGSRGAP